MIFLLIVITILLWIIAFYTIKTNKDTQEINKNIKTLKLSLLDDCTLMDRWLTDKPFMGRFEYLLLLIIQTEELIAKKLWIKEQEIREAQDILWFHKSKKQK